MEKKIQYIICESWHNRCDNAEKETKDIFPDTNKAIEKLLTLQEELSKSLGEEFEMTEDEQLYCSTPPQVVYSGEVRAFIGPKGLDTENYDDLLRHFYSSEKRRMYELKKFIPCYLVISDCRIDAVDYGCVSNPMTSYDEAKKTFDSIVKNNRADWNDEDIFTDEKDRFEAYKMGYEVEDHLYVSLVQTRLI